MTPIPHLKLNAYRPLALFLGGAVSPLTYFFENDERKRLTTGSATFSRARTKNSRIKLVDSDAAFGQLFKALATRPRRSAVLQPLADGAG